jgi:hypothetical protein
MTARYHHLLTEHAEQDRARMDAARARLPRTADAGLENGTRDAALEAAS